MNLVFSLQDILVGLLGLLVGAVLSWRYWQQRQQLQHAQQQSETQRLIQTCQFADQQRDELANAFTKLQNQHDQLRIELQESRQQISALQEQQKHAQLWRNEIVEKDKQVRSFQEQLSEAKQSRAEALARLDVQQREFVEKERLLLDARQQFATEFHVVANKLFEEKSERFSQQSRTQIGEILVPLRDQLMDFRRKVEDVYDKEAKDRTALHKEISMLRDLNVRISQDAENLAVALKGDKKTQGNWGELVLERVLEMSGLVKGREFDTQPSYRGDDGQILRPDVVVHLPDGKDVVVDSKVSLVHWEACCSASCEADAQEALRGHIQSLRNHVKNLSGKNYASMPGIKSLDFVLLFVPIEAAFLKAMEVDSQLFADAYARGMMLVCPSTLLVTLRTIQNMWRYEYQNRHALKIAECAGGLHDQFVMVVDAFKDVGDKLAKANQSYDIAWKRMVDGKGNVMRRVAELETLGAKAKRKLAVDDAQCDEEMLLVSEQVTENQV